MGERSGTQFLLAVSQPERRSGCFVKNPESHPVDRHAFLCDHPNFIYGTLSSLTSLVLITKIGVLK